MKKLLLILISLLTFTENSCATNKTYLDVNQANNTTSIYGWEIYARSKEKATIKNIEINHTTKERAIELKGDGIKSGYILGAIQGEKSWHDKENKFLEITLKTSNFFTLYVPIKTTNGNRFLTYTTHPDHINKRGKEGSLIYIPLNDEEKIANQTKSITRNLIIDLKKYEPNNKIEEVNGIMLRGDINITSVKLHQLSNDRPNVKGTIYEDGFNVHKWRVYAGGENNAKITPYERVGADGIEESLVEFQGNGIKSGYILGGINKKDAWHNKTESIISWTIIPKDNEPFTIYIPILTTKGYRYLTYTTHPDHVSKRGKEGTIIYMGINSINYNWQIFKRNLKEDLAKYEPDNKLLEVNGFMLRGSCYIDNIYLKKEAEKRVNPFDDAKFHQLLENEKAKWEKDSTTNKATINLDENHAKNLAWMDFSTEDEKHFGMRLYTLSSDNKKLIKLTEAFPTCFIDYKINFLEDNKLLNLTIENNTPFCPDDEELIYNIETSSTPFVTQYSYNEAFLD